MADSADAAQKEKAAALKQINRLKKDIKELDEYEHDVLYPLATEQVEVEFKDDGIQAIAEIAANVNERTDDIGARRLYTVMEKLLEDVSFDAPDLAGTRLVVDEAQVRERLGGLVEDEDLSRFIL